MMCYTLMKANKACFGERQERERIELFVAFAMAALHFSFVAWGVGPKQLVTNVQAL